MKKNSEADIINKMDEMLLKIIKDIHKFITDGEYDRFVHVERDSEKFCQKAFSDIKIVMPYYFREYIEKVQNDKIRNHRYNLLTLEKLAYVYIKSIMHVRMFSPDRSAIYDFLDQGNELDFKISYPSSYAATWLVYMTYKWFSVSKAESTPFFDYAHCTDICNSLCELLERNKSNLPDITPGMVSYILYALELSHKNVTARTTTQLLARDALIPLIEDWASNNDKIGLIHFDIDYFSQVNNDNDHKTGDECLKQIASKIFAIFENKNGACERHGGEEFVIALPILPEFDFDDFVESLLNSIRDIKRPNYNKSTEREYKPNMSATISYGVIEKNYLINDSFIETYDQALLILDQEVVTSKEKNERDIKIRVEKLY